MKECFVTNGTALRKKYDYIQMLQIMAALEALQADAFNRNVNIEISFVDDVEYMEKLRTPAVTDPHNIYENIVAIDAIARYVSPDSITILGAGDIIPFFSFKNPCYSDVSKDPDEKIFSDLPYACVYNKIKCTEIEDFLNPVRSVTRLPDVLNSAKDKSLEIFIKTINNLCNVKKCKSDDYTGSNFAVSCEKYKSVMRENLTKIGVKGSVKQHTVPCEKPSWQNVNYASLTHYFYLHGIKGVDVLFGESSSDSSVRPEAFYGHEANGRLQKGMIALLHSCYGAKLYQPNYEKNSNPPIANVYLSNGAIAYCGSTSATFGCQERNLADSILNEFYNKCISGESIGEAFLYARKYAISLCNTMDDFQKKIISEWVVYGEASLVVTAASGLGLNKSIYKKNQLKVSCDGENLTVPFGIKKQIEEWLKEDKPLKIIPKRIVFAENGADSNIDEMFYDVSISNGDVYIFHTIDNLITDVRNYYI